MPFAPRFPYEVWVVPKEHVESLLEFDGGMVTDLAKAIKAVVAGYEKAFYEGFPYMMMLFQRPKDTSCFHFHVEFAPPMRSKDKRKWRASVETGAGNFILPVSPEDAAATLRDAICSLGLS